MVLVKKSKCHQLPYLKSNIVLSHHLKLVYFDVWGGDAPKSLGDKQYYVSLIDDYTKLSRIYSLKFKSEVFHKFVEL